MLRTVARRILGILQQIVANDDVKRLGIEEFEAVDSHRRGKRKFCAVTPQGFRLLASNSKHLFGTIKQHDLKS